MVVLVAITGGNTVVVLVYSNASPLAYGAGYMIIIIKHDMIRSICTGQNERGLDSLLGNWRTTAPPESR